MNKKHFQPALFLYGDCVYEFNAFNSDDQNENFFERTYFKSFYKITKKYNVSIPLNFYLNYKLGLINKKTQSLKEINYDKKLEKLNLILI